MKSSCMFWELSRKMMDGWTSLIYNPRATDIPKAAVALHNRKITDNSSEAHPCLFLCPTCLKRSCLSVVAHMSCRIGSKRLRSPSQVQHTERCVCVCLWVGGRLIMCTGVFSQPGLAIILNPALVVLDKAHLAFKSYPRSGQK